MAKRLTEEQKEHNNQLRRFKRARERAEHSKTSLDSLLKEGFITQRQYDDATTHVKMNAAAKARDWKLWAELQQTLSYVIAEKEKNRQPDYQI